MKISGVRSGRRTTSSCHAGDRLRLRPGLHQRDRADPCSRAAPIRASNIGDLFGILMYSTSCGTIWLSHRPEMESRVWLESIEHLQKDESAKCTLLSRCAAPCYTASPFASVFRMILPRYHIAASRIPGAGKGLFLDEPVAAGRLITAPDDIRKVYKWRKSRRCRTRRQMLGATVRWFEDRYTVTPEWPDECYINHGFEPYGLWHLGFVFARPTCRRRGNHGRLPPSARAGATGGFS